MIIWAERFNSLRNQTVVDNVPWFLSTNINIRLVFKTVTNKQRIMTASCNVPNQHIWEGLKMRNNCWFNSPLKCLCHTVFPCMWIQVNCICCIVRVMHVNFCCNSISITFYLNFPWLVNDIFLDAKLGMSVITPRINLRINYDLTGLQTSTMLLNHIPYPRSLTILLNHAP
jgi:hypothetical protein